MEQVNICMHDYRGFCMFGDACEKKHFKETCNNKDCISSACHKIHPRFCYFSFTFGNCKFGHECSYLHETPGYANSTRIVVEMRGNLEEVKSLKIEIEIKVLKEENKSKEVQ